MATRAAVNGFDPFSLLCYISASHRGFPLADVSESRQDAPRIQAGSAACNSSPARASTTCSALHRSNRMPSSSIERIGIDESGKGDYFGPLVIAAVFVDATTQEELTLMAVRDSKKISDGRILELAPDIKTICPHSVIAIGPQKYNELYGKIRNLNRLLAWGHAKALETLLERVSCERAISDQFGDERLILNALQEKGRRIVLEQRTKAESDLAV